ncbi:MAG: aminotransferase class III-fold pyridoxal phosphate-dependent enzyme [bacterium]|nr:aminotransferase class III-fold pyridoxal phosphate-dependent enzyme [bacterium]
MPDYRGRARRHLSPHFTRGAAWRADDLVVIERGEGCYVWDTDGNEYLDGLAGLFCTNLGHGRSDLAAATAKQLDKLGFYPNWGFAHPSSVEAASLVTAVAPGGLDPGFFVSSGSEAVESAVKFARCYHLANGDEGCYKVIARHWLLLRPGTDARPRLGRRTQRRRGRRSAARGLRQIIIDLSGCGSAAGGDSFRPARRPGAAPAACDKADDRGDEGQRLGDLDR